MVLRCLVVKTVNLLKQAGKVIAVERLPSIIRLAPICFVIILANWNIVGLAVEVLLTATLKESEVR